MWPENLAAICLPLSDDASWVTGEVWSINGGITYRRNAAGGLAAWLAILVLQMKSFGATSNPPYSIRPYPNRVSPHDDGVGEGAGELHLAVCRRFGRAARSADGKWNRPSPCAAWDARGVLEHVIGFHDVLLLRPLGLKPDRPRDDPQQRWQLTFDRLCEALRRDGLFERVIEVPSATMRPPKGIRPNSFHV